jgi:hypothetical protein
MKKKKADEWIAVLTIKNLNRLSIERRINLAGWLNDKAVEIGSEKLDEYASTMRYKYAR